MARAVSPKRGRGGEQAAGKEKAKKAQPAPRKGREPERELPIKGYERLTVTQVSGKLRPLSRVELRKLASFERAHRKRKGVLDAIERHLKGGGQKPAMQRAGQPGR